MIGYVTLGTNDLPKAVAFYDKLLGSLGAKHVWQSEQGTAWGTGEHSPGLGVMKPHDGKAATRGNGTMVALAVDSKEKVDDAVQPGDETGRDRRRQTRSSRRGFLCRLLSRPGRQQAELFLHGLANAVIPANAGIQ